MTQEEITEGDILIAKWLDYEYIPINKASYDWGWWGKGTFKGDNSYNNLNFLCINDSGLKFHCDSNWQWRVVKNIGFNP